MEKRIMFISSLFFTMIAMIIMIIFSNRVFIDSSTISKSKESFKNQYFRYLVNGFKSYTFDEQYCKTGFNHFNRIFKGEFTKYGYTELLEDFIVYISTDLDTTIKADTLLFHSASLMLKRARETEPFSSLPSEERRLMDNIQLFIQNNDINNSINLLNELKQVILLRNREYERIANQNAWSIPLAFIGVSSTILFGIVTSVRIIRRQ